jgi:hypothetical protein
VRVQSAADTQASVEGSPASFWPASAPGDSDPLLHPALARANDSESDARITSDRRVRFMGRLRSKTWTTASAAPPGVDLAPALRILRVLHRRLR